MVIFFSGACSVSNPAYSTINELVHNTLSSTKVSFALMTAAPIRASKLLHGSHTRTASTIHIFPVLLLLLPLLLPAIRWVKQ